MKNKKAEEEWNNDIPCFNNVAVIPIYVPRMPCSPTIVRTPWKKPLYFLFSGGLLNWSWISFVLIVSIGVTATMASVKPAPNPAKNVFDAEIVPSGF